MEALHAGRRERLRQRLEAEGIMDFQEHEVLEFLLYYVDARGDTNPAAHALLDRFGSLEEVFRAEANDLRRLKGVGSRGAAWFGRLQALMQRYASLDSSARPRLNTPRRADSFARGQLRAEDEGVWQLCLSRGGRMLLSTRMGPGSTWGESMALRDALADVLAVQANSVLIVQKVGENDLRPTDYDARRTLAYATTLAAVGVTLLDHLLIGPQCSLSLAFSGALPGIARPGGAEQTLARELLEQG